MIKPKYKHHNSNHEFLGHFAGHDIYFCQETKLRDEKISFKHYLARNSKERGSYLVEYDLGNLMEKQFSQIKVTGRIKMLATAISLFAMDFAVTTLWEEEEEEDV